MTPKEQKSLTQSIQANRRMLSLLDKRIEDLLKTSPSLLLEYDVEDRLPFFYGTFGSDNQLGIIMTSANVGENPSFGYVRMHTDSAFVLTRISAVLSREYFDSLGSPQRFLARAAFGFGLRFYDESSSRWITFTNQNGEPQQKASFPVEAFCPFSVYNEGGFELPAECVFPRSAVIRVEAYAQDQNMLVNPIPSDILRLHLVFQGYKVFGG